MSLPKNLFRGYQQLKNSRLVQKRSTDADALTHFQTILNAAQPANEKEQIIYDLVKLMYNADKRAFLQMVRKNKLACLVLWTESRAIVDFLNLRQIAYIKWNGRETLYSVTEFQASTNTDTVAYEHPIVRQRRLNETKETKAVDCMPSIELPKSDETLTSWINGESVSQLGKASWADMSEDSVSNTELSPVE